MNKIILIIGMCMIMFGVGLVSADNQSINETNTTISEPNLLEVDFSQVFNIILFSLLIIASFSIFYLFDRLVGGGLLFLIGLFLVFNNINLIISIIIMLLGVLMINSHE